MCQVIGCKEKSVALAAVLGVSRFGQSVMHIDLCEKHHEDFVKEQLEAVSEGETKEPELKLEGKVGAGIKKKYESYGNKR